MFLLAHINQTRRFEYATSGRSYAGTAEDAAMIAVSLTGRSFRESSYSWGRGPGVRRAALSRGRGRVDQSRFRSPDRGGYGVRYWSNDD